jgi:hypothetical protein
MFRAGHVPPGTPTRMLVDDLWQEYERVVKQLRKISVPANDVGSSCFRCGARWSEGEKEHHCHGCVLEGTEPASAQIEDLGRQHPGVLGVTDESRHRNRRC